MRILLTLFSCSILLLCKAQGPYAPAVGHANSTAIHMDSSTIVDWATSCSVQRGWVNIADTSLGRVTVGEAHFASGKADQHGVVSLGDGGEAILTFNGKIFDGPGPDFAVFENSFSDTFLELAFVEVSSDGQNFFRFPAHSLTDTAQQVGGFGTMDPTNIHNLAGKYSWSYGTPFDLADLIGTPGLDIQSITHIKIIDVVGSLDSAYLNRDSRARPINDPYPTPFPSGGFDLDGVGVMHISGVGIDETSLNDQITVYPNPVNDQLKISHQGIDLQEYQLIDLGGRVILRGLIGNQLDLSNIPSGQYILRIISDDQVATKKIIKR
ncbi:MAG: secretion protein [Flavobacteriales bacterium]|nr:secretion protein [Flavobacteriales bacterium]